MPDNETMPGNDSSANLYGCNFDEATARALNGKDVIALVTNSTGERLLAVAGQQGLSYNMSQETTDAGATKDESGGWTLKFHGTKSWDASIDGLYSPDDEATQLVAQALENDEYVCLKICKRTINADKSVTYQPLRMGLAIVTSDNFDAGMEDNATYSMDFDGSGKPWIYETASDEERLAAAWTVQPDGDDDTEDTTEG